MNSPRKQGPDNIPFGGHIMVCCLIFLPWFIHPITPFNIVGQLSLVGPIVMAIVEYSLWELIALYALIVFLTRKSTKSRVRTCAAIGAVALSLAGASYPDWLLYAYSHNVEIASFLPGDEMFLPPGEVKRFEQAFGTPAVEWSGTGRGGPWLTVPRDRYSPAMEIFLRQEAERRGEPGGVGNRSQPVRAETDPTPPAGGPLLGVCALASYIALMALVWRVSNRPQWRVRAVIYGWGLCVVWALLWAVVLPWSFRAIMDSHTVATTFPDGMLVLWQLAFGWVWPLVVVAIAGYCHRKEGGQDQAG